jgi:hypothetical protein
VLVGQPETGDRLGYLGADERRILKWMSVK